MNNHDYGGCPLDIKPCVSVAPHINNHDYVGRPLDINPYNYDCLFVYMRCY
jgi:hypothetical protein